MEYLEILDKLNDIYYKLNYAQLSWEKLHTLREQIQDEKLKEELNIFVRFQDIVSHISNDIEEVKIYGSTINKTEKELFDYYFTLLEPEDYVEVLEEENDILNYNQGIPY